MASLTRREFLFLGVAAGATAGVGLVVPLTLIQRDGASVEVPDPTAPAAVVASFPKVRVASLAALNSGQPVSFDYPGGGQTNYAVKLASPTPGGVGPDGDIVGFSRICTHMGCVVDEFDAETATLGPCPCHFTTFDFANNGSVVLGQATQNLPRVMLEVDGDDVHATGLLRLIYGYRSSLLDVELIGATS